MTTSLSTTQVVDVQEFIDGRPFTARHAVILVLCLLMMIADGFDVASVGFVAPVLVREWAVNANALGLAISASVAGLALGAVIAGPIADRIGRKPVLLLSVVAFALCTLATTTSTTLMEFTIWRFVTGLGLGAASPNATTLLAEWMPARCRALMLNLMYCGFTLGAALGGLIASHIIPFYGWRGVFIVGGVAPLLFVLPSIFLLPESTRFMVAKRWSSERIRRALSLLGGLNADQAYEFRAGKEDAIVSDTSIWRIVFSKRFRIGTAMLWVAFFTGNGMFYVLASWLPTVLKESGVPVSGAALYSSLFPLGGAVGAIVCGRLMDKVNPHTAVSAAWCLAGMFTFALASVIGDPGLLPFAIAAIGFMVGAGLVSIPTLAATFYPTQARASGVAWMAGFGRLGGIAGAYIGAIMLGAGLSGAEVIRALVAPAVIASIAIAMKGMSVNPLPAVAKA